MAKQPTVSPGAGQGVVLPNRLGGKARSANNATSIQKGQALRSDRQAQINVPSDAVRRERTAPALVRTIAETNGLGSTALINLLSVADNDYQIEAYTTWTQEFSREGLRAAEMVLSAWDTNWDYSKGYADRRSLSLHLETALWEVAQTAGIGLELIVDTYRLPRGLALFPYDQVEYLSGGNGRKYPAQRPIGGQVIELDYPTIFVAESVKSADRTYALPFVASGAQRLVHYEEFIEDMRRILRRAGEPRITAELLYDRLVEAAPAEVRSDPKKLAAYLDDYRVQVEDLLSGLEPEDALVLYDLVKIDKIESAGEKKDYKELLSEISGQAASALKSNPSMLGMRSGGSQNVATVEAMLSTKIARRLQKPVEEVFSRALTLAIRLFGVDAYVKLKFKPINLRPEEELAAHRAMDQDRILELLSLGLITDDEAQVMLGLRSRPDGAPELSGTGFYDKKAPDTTPASGTNARNAAITPPGPSSAGGPDNEQRP